MTDFKADKIIDINTLTPIPDTLYLHRVGDGFDLYCSNQAGLLQKLNDKVGDLTALHTNAKDNVVASINEIIDNDNVIIAAGRPDDVTTLTAAVQTKVATAPNLTIFRSTDGAGVNAYEWQLQSGKWQPTNADTGWHRITAGNASEVNIRRKNNTVYMSINRYTGTRINLPYGFGLPDSFNQVVGTNLDTAPFGKVEIIGQYMAKLQSDQMYPFYGSATDKTTYWQHRPQVIRQAYTSTSGGKGNFQFLTEQPYPSTLSFPQQSRNLLPVTVERKTALTNRITGSSNFNNVWDKLIGLANSDNKAVFPAGAWLSATGTLTAIVQTTPPAHSKSEIHLMPAAVHATHGGGANALNGVLVEYSTDGTNYTTAFTVSGVTDTQTEPFKQAINATNITHVRLTKAGSPFAVGGLWLGVYKN